METKTPAAQVNATRARRRAFGAAVWMMLTAPAVGLMTWSTQPGILAILVGLVIFCTGGCLFEATRRPAATDGEYIHASDPRVGIVVIILAASLPAMAYASNELTFLRQELTYLACGMTIAVSLMVYAMRQRDPGG